MKRFGVQRAIRRLRDSSHRSLLSRIANGIDYRHLALPCATAALVVPKRCVHRKFLRTGYVP